MTAALAAGTNPLTQVSETVDVSVWAEARCRTENAQLLDLFFSEELQDIARAKTLCAECPVMAECLEGAIERGEPWGVWGGQLFRNGRVLMVKRRRGRPPKVARAEDHIPTVAVPAHLEPMLRTA